MKRITGKRRIIRAETVRIHTAWMIILLLMMPRGCIEPYDPDIGEEEGFIVIEASLIKGQQVQQVVISQSSTFNDKPMNPLNGCRVEITDDLYNRYEFYEAGDGRYEVYIPEFL